MPEPTTTTWKAVTTGFARRDDMPKVVDMPSLAEQQESFTTPPISIPSSTNNPFIIRQNNPTGTVFIAVGAIVGAILLGFILYHLIVSITASRLAKRARNHEKQMYEKYESNNSNAYGFTGATPTSTLNNFNGLNEYSNNSVSKLPLLSNTTRAMSTFINFNGSQAGDASTISEAQHQATAKQDLTKMFISPTAEVMQHKRVRSSFNPSSLTNLPFGASSTTLMNQNRHSQIPSLYINNNNSDYSVSQQEQQAQDEGSDPLNQSGRANRRALPSMYLEDLIDKE
ncbi:Vacuolar membrane protein [Spathaspora sp. JA1]|nr:Vacuolar membrane protein [Spathaspora sp. JA1]